ncbi:hypothetical protein [Methanolobus sp. WCC4]|uniref:hypothetical protein n=1 Tax=Methanolobus sp. WCC4 TaxID=3125784 RepID=UPI0030FA23C3
MDCRDDGEVRLGLMRELCRTRPLKYSDLDHLKKGSTKFLHENGYSLEGIAEALELGLRDVENNLKGTGYELDYRKIAPFEDKLPDNIGDVITIKVPTWGKEDVDASFKAKVRQCIPRGGGCGLSVILLEDAGVEIPLFGKCKKGDEIVVPLEWYI